ncbi:metallophosphoesterase, partial [Streptomyces sp. E11-3]
MIVLVVLAALAGLAVFAALHWYVWRRLVRDTTAPRGVGRRAGTAVFVAGPLLMVGALVSGRAGLPFRLQQVLAWPGYMWLALSLYVLLALLMGEAVRPLLRRFLERRAAAKTEAEAAPVVEEAPVREAQPVAARSGEGASASAPELAP